jgi:pre-mRNA-splicing factor ISY1
VNWNCFCLLLQLIAEWDAKEQERLDAFAAVQGRKAEKLQQQEQADEAQFVAFVPLPDQAAIEQLVLEKKKQDLLAKYTSNSLLQQQQQAKTLLNKR